jgi:hypothetical protein
MSDRSKWKDWFLTLFGAQFGCIQSFTQNFYYQSLGFLKCDLFFVVLFQQGNSSLVLGENRYQYQLSTNCKD